MSAPVPSSLAPGLALSPGATIGADVTIGANVVIHAGVVLADGCEIGDGAVLGRAPSFGPRSRAAHVWDEDTVTTIDSGAHVGTGAIVVAGAHVGAGAQVGFHALVREGAVIGPEVVLGHAVAVAPRVSVGARTRIFNNSVLAMGTVVEDEVDVSVNVVTATRTWGTTDLQQRGVALRRGCRIGANTVLFPGIEVGAEAVVGACSLVDADVAAGTTVVGTPARPLHAPTS